ncbi:MAG: extracellular solute-binding protein [Pseudomonadota bacterium]
MSKPFRPIGFLAALATMAALALAGCSRSDPAPGQAVENAAGPPAEPRGVVNLYSTRHYDSDKLLFERFERDTGIRVRVREAGAAQLLETMAAEGGQSPADVILAADAGTLWRFKDRGLTAPIGSDVAAAAVPESLRDTDGHWTGLAKRYRVIAYDPARHGAGDVDEIVDLAQERFDGEICVRSSANIYNLSLLAEVIDRRGAEAAGQWAKSVAANFARDPQGGDTAQIEAIAAGACSAAIVNHYYWVRLAESGSAAQRARAEATALSFADAGNGVHTNVTGAALAAHAPNADHGREFIEYLLTLEGQALLVSETREFPVVAGAALPSGLEALTVGPESDLALSVLGENQSEAQVLYDLAGWD